MIVCNKYIVFTEDRVYKKDNNELIQNLERNNTDYRIEMNKK